MKSLNFVFFLPLFSSLCFSQVRQGDINFGFSLGLNFNQVTEYDEVEYTTNLYSISVSMGYSFTNNINCGVLFGLQNSNFEDFNIDVHDSRITNQERLSIRPFIKYYFKPENKNRIFLQVNGVYNHRLEKENKHIIIVYPVIKGSKDEIGLSVSPGVELSLGSKWSAVGSLSAIHYLKNFQKPCTRTFSIGSGGSIGLQRNF